jgi:hypothetical protein
MSKKVSSEKMIKDIRRVSRQLKVNQSCNFLRDTYLPE